MWKPGAIWKPVLLVAIGVLATIATTDDAARITSDSTEFCGQLAAVLARAPDRPREAVELHSEGVTLCAHGHLRAGIARLRREALLLRARGEVPGAQ